MSDTDVIEHPTNDTGEFTAPPVAEAKPEKAPRVKKEPAQPHPCLCPQFGYGDDDSEFDIECNATTLRLFGQGHDARLTSTLVNAHFDGYSIWRTIDGTRVVFDDPGHAMASVSEALAAKADAATKNAQAKIDAKNARLAEREQAKQAKKAEKEAAAAEKAELKRVAAEAKEAEKTAQPRPVAAKVQTGTAEGAPVAQVQEDGTTLVLIKVGRGTYDAVLSQDKTTVTYRDADGAEQTREADTVRMLSQFV